MKIVQQAHLMQTFSQFPIVWAMKCQIHYSSCLHGICSGTKNLWMTMTHVHYRVHAQEVEVFFAIYIPCFRSLGSHQSDLQTYCISDPPALLEHLTYGIWCKSARHIIIIVIYHFLSLWREGVGLYLRRCDRRHLNLQS